MNAAIGEAEISRDALAIENLYRQHQAAVLKAAYRITGNWSDAEDVLQTVFLRLVRRPEAAPENVGGYLYRAAINGALDALRTRQESRHIPLDDAPDLPSAVPLPDGAQVGREMRAWFRQALARLQPRAAEMFALRYLEGVTNPEIARLMKTSQAVVAVTLYRSRRKLESDYRTYTKTR